MKLPSINFFFYFYEKKNRFKEWDKRKDDLQYKNYTKWIKLWDKIEQRLTRDLENIEQTRRKIKNKVEFYLTKGIKTTSVYLFGVGLVPNFRVPIYQIMAHDKASSASKIITLIKDHFLNFE